MLKVFTSVFVLENMAVAFDGLEAALKRNGSDGEESEGNGRRRHVVELHVKLEAPLRQTGGRD